MRLSPFFLALCQSKKVSTGFTPADLNPIGWYKSNLGITLSGSRVMKWNNQGTSGSAANLYMDTFSAMPFLSASHPSFNNRPVLSFNGTSQTLGMTGSSDTVFDFTTNNFTIMVIGRARNGGGGARFVDKRVTSGYILSLPSTTIIRAFAQSAASVQDDETIALNTSYFFRFRHLHGVSETVFVNETGSATAGNVGGSLSNNRVFFVGSANGAALFADMELAELIVLDRDLTAGEITNLKTYVNSEYNLGV